MRLTGTRLMIIAFAAIVLLAAAVVFTSRESPENSAAEFMSALSKGDVPELMKLSYEPSIPRDKLQEEWTFATKDAGRYYVFQWRTLSSTSLGPGSASVHIQVIRNALDRGAYPEDYELHLVEEQGHWLVDVSGMSPDIYPALPGH